MNISLFSDELSADPATAFELARGWGIERFEIRKAYGFRAPVGPAWVNRRIAAEVRKAGVMVTGISPGLFKPVMRIEGDKIPCSAATPDEVRRHIDEVLPSCLEFAELLDTPNITAFAPGRGEGLREVDPPAIVTEALAEAAERTAAAGRRLLLENCIGTWADTADVAARVLAAPGCESIPLVWDPANAAWVDPGTDHVAEGYPLVRDRVGSVHVKDFRLIDGRRTWVMLGDGVVDWPRQIRLLAEDGYDGLFVAEPHLRGTPGEGERLVERVEELCRRLMRLVGGGAVEPVR
jgi:sugar phosphate isomerase/epimerase